MKTLSKSLTPCTRIPRIFSLCRTACLGLALGVTLWMPGRSAAQEPEEMTFKVYAVAPDTVALIEDFDRYLRYEDWAKAFRALDEIFETAPEGMLAADDGFYVPLLTVMAQKLSAMPEAARRAYVLFSDASARRQWEQLPEGDRYGWLQWLYARYFPTSVGDEIADAMGDAAYERGLYLQAAAHWKKIIDQHPESEIEPARLWCKRAMALARAGRWTDYDHCLQTIQSRYAGSRTTVGGRDVEIVAYLESTFGAKRRGTSAPEAAATPPVVLPSTNRPSWRFEMLDDADRAGVVTMLQQYSGRPSSPSAWRTFIADTVLTDSRVYLNWMGCCAALDIRTGKLLWRSVAFDSVIADNTYQIMRDACERPAALAVDQGVVVGTGVLIGPERGSKDDKKRSSRNSRAEPAAVAALDAGSGDVLWRSDQEESLKQWRILSRPCIDSDHVFFVGRHGNDADVHMLAIGMRTGTLEWSSPLGTYPSNNSYSYGQAPRTPMGLVLHDRSLYVLTNLGALLAFDLDTKELVWAFTHDSVTPRSTNRSWAYMQAMAQDFATYSDPLFRNGVLYFKGSLGDHVFALAPQEISLAWTRPASRSDMIVDVRNDRLFLLGREVSAIDANSLTMRWSTRLPTATHGLRACIRGGRMYVFTPRGVHEVDLEDGDVLQIFRGIEEDSVGGGVWIDGKRLITVSDTGVTAYSLGDGSGG